MKFGIITHYSGMREDFLYLEEKLNCKLIFKVGVLDLAIDVAKTLINVHGVDAILVASKTAEVLKNHVEIPLIPLYTTNFNLIESFIYAKKFGNSIAFADITKEDYRYDFTKVKNLVDFDVVYYPFDNIDETEEVVLNAKADNIEVIVTTASCLVSKAKKENVKTVLIEIKESEFIDAIERAKDVVQIRNKELEKSQWVNAVVQKSDRGLITLDKDGYINVFNKSAERLLNIPYVDNIMMKTLAEAKNDYPILGQIADIENDIDVVIQNKHKVVVNLHKMIHKGGYAGSVIRISSFEVVKRLEMSTRKKENPEGFIAKNTFEDIKGYSEPIKEAKRKSIMYAKTNSNILIYGESGTGKELFAQSIHNYSEYSSGPFLALNCATLSENLLESELFGYDKGAFTGANKDGKKGVFELAHNGTLFLDEVAEMPIGLQARMLRVIQERVVRRLGGQKNIPINVRVICATNKDLYKEVKENNFRKDLYYRINVLSITLPPLRKRKEDIKIIAQNLITKTSESLRKEIYVSDEQLDKLKMNNWYGNVRELSNFIERLVAMTAIYKVEDDLYLELLREVMALENEEDLLDEMRCVSDIAKIQKNDTEEILNIQANINCNNDGTNEDFINVPIKNMKDIEGYIIKELLERYDGDKKKISKELGLSPTTVWRKIKEIKNIDQKEKNSK